jgi:Matrixin
LTTLLEAADFIGRGQVTAVQSFWSPDHTLIESEARIAIDYQLVGVAEQQVVVRAAGGYLAEEGLGMVSTHSASFTVGEEVLLFLTKAEGGWQVVEGATGKFLVQGAYALNHDLAVARPLTELFPTIAARLQQQGIAAQWPADWQQREGLHLATMVSAESTPTPVRRWATPPASAAFYINLNSDQVGGEAGNAADFRNAIIAAAAGWSGVTDSDFTLTYAGATTATATGYNGVNEILFMPKGRQERAAAAQAWYTADQTIVEADIWINDDYVWNATGAPAANELDLQSALLHEFGHWLILGHCPQAEAVMFARLVGGTLKRELQPPDLAGIRAIYPR